MDAQLQQLIDAQNQVNTEIQKTSLPQSLLMALQRERTCTQALVNGMQDHSTRYGRPAFSNRGGGGGILGTLGRAVEWGAGFGIGESIVNKIL